MIDQKYYNRIICDPNILSGKPTIKHTRIPVELVLKLLSQGVDYNEILQEYPDLQKQDILAVLDYARSTIASEEVHHAEPAFAG